MAQQRKARRQARAAQAQQEPRRRTLVLGLKNVLLLVAGVVVILVGYLLLDRGSITAAPLLLVIGYCVMVPLALVLWTKKSDDRKQSGLGE